MPEEYAYPVEVERPSVEREVYKGTSAGTLPDGMTLVAMATADVDVYERAGGTDLLVTVPARTILGTPTVLTITEGPQQGWARVRLPVRPNGSTGWVRVADMGVYVVQGHMVVDLSERTLAYYENGEMIVETSVAVGGDSARTPIGEFFITDNVTLADPNSPWGPHAFGLSARSDTITEFNGGDGIIGIHGTNRPDSIGNAVSLGCIRVPNDVITQLHEIVPIGTPVQVKA